MLLNETLESMMGVNFASNVATTMASERRSCAVGWRRDEASHEGLQEKI